MAHHVLFRRGHDRITSIADVRFAALLTLTGLVKRRCCCIAMAMVLEQRLGEEKAADQKLTSIAESKVNLKAAQRHSAQPDINRGPPSRAPRSANRIIAHDPIGRKTQRASSPHPLS